MQGAHLEVLVGFYCWTCISQPPMEIVYWGFSEVKSVNVCNSESIVELCDAVAYLKSTEFRVTAVNFKSAPVWPGRVDHIYLRELRRKAYFRGIHQQLVCEVDLHCCHAASCTWPHQHQWYNLRWGQSLVCNCKKEIYTCELHCT